MPGQPTEVADPSGRLNGKRCASLEAVVATTSVAVAAACQSGWRPASPPPPTDTTVYAQRGDRLTDVAQRYGVDDARSLPSTI